MKKHLLIFLSILVLGLIFFVNSCCLELHEFELDVEEESNHPENALNERKLSNVCQVDKKMPPKQKGV